MKSINFPIYNPFRIQYLSLISEKTCAEKTFKLLPLMAIRFEQSSKLLKSVRYYTRTFSSAPSTSISAVSPLNFAEKPEPTVEKPAVIKPSSSSLIDIHDHEKLFAPLSTTKLLRAAFNLHLAAVEPVVDLGTWVMNSKLVDVNLTKEIVFGTVRHTFYEHFCAGGSAPEAENCIRKANDTGLRGMLVYAVEHTDDNSECDQNLQGFLETVRTAKSLPPSSVSFYLIFHVYFFFFFRRKLQ